MLKTKFETNELGDSCQFCRTKLVCDPETGEQICGSCGVVNDFSEDSSSLHFSRTAPVASPMESDADSRNSMMYDINLPSIIGNENFDAHGNTIHENWDLTRIRQLDNSLLSRDSNRRSLSRAIDTIKRVVESLSLTETVAERAYQIYRHVNGNEVGRRKSIVGIALASVYIACKELGIARSSTEIENVMRDINPRGIRRYCRLLARELNMNVTTPNPSSFVPRIVAAAKLSGRVERMALEILSRVKDNPSLCARKPVPLAAAAVFLAARLNSEQITQLRIACAAEVTPITIRKRSLELLEALKVAPTSQQTKSALERLQETTFTGGSSNQNI